MGDPAKEIIKAAKSGDTSRIRELLATDRSLVNALDKDGSTPLHCAVWKGQQEAVVLLLDTGADVNRHKRTKLRRSRRFIAGSDHKPVQAP